MKNKRAGQMFIDFENGEEIKYHPLLPAEDLETSEDIVSFSIKLFDGKVVKTYGKTKN